MGGDVDEVGAGDGLGGRPVVSRGPSTLMRGPAESSPPARSAGEFTKRVVEPKADAVFISCTALRTVGAIEALEADLGKPVVSAIQVTFWDALRVAQVGDDCPGFGSLFGH